MSDRKKAFESNLTARYNKTEHYLLIRGEQTTPHRHATCFCK